LTPCGPPGPRTLRGENGRPRPGLHVVLARDDPRESGPNMEVAETVFSSCPGGGARQSQRPQRSGGTDGWARFFRNRSEGRFDRRPSAPGWPGAFSRGKSQEKTPRGRPRIAQNFAMACPAPLFYERGAENESSPPFEANKVWSPDAPFVQRWPKSAQPDSPSPPVPPRIE